MSKIECPLMDSDVYGFSCLNSSIEAQIRDSYFITLLKQAYGHQILVDGKNVGYYMLHFKSINLCEIDQIIGQEYQSCMAEKYIAIHIRYLAVDKNYQKNGIGTYVLKGLIVQFLSLAQKYPIRIITIDALPKYIKWYESIGFKDIPGASSDGITMPMFIDCMKQEEAFKLQQYCESFI